MSYYTPEDRRPPTTPQMALRVATLGFIALALFAIVFFRLWYLQVLAGDKYLAEANQNRVRDRPIAAPRGDIVDRNGVAIVNSRLANVVQLSPSSLPKPERIAAATWGQQATTLAKHWTASHTARWRNKHKAAVPPLPPYPAIPVSLTGRFTSIGRVLHMRPTTIQQRVIRSLATLPYAAITLRIDVPGAMLDYFGEHKRAYPGVTPDTLFLRRYPERQLASQLLGNVGQVSPGQLKESRFRGVHQGTIVGKSGVELAYDRYLRGHDGARVLQVDALGNFSRELVRSRRNPTPGRTIKLSLDLGLQKAGQDALLRAEGAANANGNPSRAGAFVALNPGNGEILAMGSSPSFDPTVFTKPISVKHFAELNSEANGAPLFDRAIQGQYPTGSTFKPFTALAALQSGKFTPAFTVADSGCIKIGGVDRCNAGHAANGSVDMVNALKVSSDVYFYTLGLRLNSAHTETIQNMARGLGLGHATGIDLPGEFKGNIPDWRWRQRIAKVEAACRRKKHIPLGETYSVYLAVARGCGISDMRQWSEGDNVNLAVGQGDVQATPLQMAVAYSGFVENGRVPRPHLGLEIEDSNGNPIQKIQPAAAHHVHIDPAARQTVLEGLHAAASAPGGTSTPVWGGWDQGTYPVYGKTGTAQTFDHGIEYDQSWYVCWIQDTAHPKDPGLVIAVTVEKGGFGAEAAAPAARLIAAHYFRQKASFIQGTSRTR